MGKIFRRTLTALLIVIFALSAAIVGAKIQMYTATGEDYANEVESQDIAKLRARDKAIKKATKEAGVYLKTYSRSVNSELTEDEVTAITSNAWQLVSEPKYSSKIVKGSDETSIIIWTATVEVNVDDSELQSWIKRDDKDKSTIIEQTRETQKASEENDRKIEDLREKYKRATSQADKDRIIKQMTDADRDFLANQKLEEATKLYFARDYKGAIKLCNEALKFNSKLVEAYRIRNKIYFALGEYQKSIDDCNRAIEIVPNYFFDYVDRGFSYDELGKYQPAIDDYNKAIQLNPNYKDIYKFRGVAYRRLKQYDKAIQDFNKAIQLNPKDAYAYVFRGTTYGILDKQELAIQDYTKSIELGINSEETYCNRGSNYFELNQYEKAIQDFNKAIQINPNYFKAYNYRGMAYARLEQYDIAIKDFSKAIELKPNYSEAYNSRGNAYTRLKKYDLAVKDYTKAIEFNNPALDMVYRNRGYAYALSGHFAQAVPDLTKSIELNPNVYQSYLLRSMCYKQLGDMSKAQADFAKAKQLGYND